MSAPLSDERREILPRWRDLTKTIGTGELSPRLAASSPGLGHVDFLESKIADWNRERSLAFANEAVGAALVLGRQSEVRDAAEFILTNRAVATAPSIHIAERILGKLAPQPDVNELDLESLQNQVRHFKRLTQSYPRNAFAWAELARNYAIRGMTAQAIRAMNVALGLGPNNRYILRSAARLYTHVGDFSQAHRIIVRAEATRDDPWLIAAEIGTAALADSGSKFAKLGLKMVESKNFSAFETAELASALATLDAKAADFRRSRKLFRLSLINPNENAVAQARWATTKHIIEIDPKILKVPRTFEARAWYSFYSGEWKTSLQESKKWLRDQPFSAAPAVHASYVAAVSLEEHDQALDIINRGLVANPHDGNLLNNRAYSLASLGRLPEAKADVANLFGSPIDDTAEIQCVEPVPLATLGLIYFRAGEIERGRSLYHRAIKTAQKRSDKRTAAKAALFLAFEEIRAGKDYREASEQALLMSSEYSNADFTLLRLRLERELKSRLLGSN